MSKSSSRSLAVLLAALSLALTTLAGPVLAGPRLDEWKGHLSVGYTMLAADSHAPGGSMSFGGGVEYPITSRWRLGPSLAFHLLGSSQVQKGSVIAGLDYSLFESALMMTLVPERGPFTRLSFGPGVALPKVDLSVAGGGAAFGDYTVHEVRPEFAANATLSPRRLKVVAVGLDLGARFITRSTSSWTTFTTSFTILY